MSSQETLLSKVRVLVHDCVRIESATGYVVYIDPYGLEEAFQDADAVLSTHDHFDHFSPEDIARVVKPGYRLVVPESLAQAACDLGASDVCVMRAGDKLELCEGVRVEAVPSYNVGKQFHPQENGWLGYVVEVDGARYFHMGDTDRNPDNEHVPCDVLLIPVGGTYTMDAAEAVECALSIRPRIAVPMHYGSVVGSPEDGGCFAELLAVAQEGVDEPVPAVLLMGR